MFKNILAASLLALSFILPVHAAEKLKRVENHNVCMVTDMHFSKKQIPVDHAGNTYYGCCNNCKATLSKDATARVAVDPVSGKKIDKAKAVIAAKEDNSVLYFESEKTLKAYEKKNSLIAN